MSYEQLQKAKLHTNIRPTGQKHEPLLNESDKRLLANEISSALNSEVKKTVADTPELKNMREVVEKHHGEVIANQLSPDALKSLYEQVKESDNALSANSQQLGAPSLDEYFSTVINPQGTFAINSPQPVRRTSNAPNFDEHIEGSFNPQANNVPDPKDYFLGD
ncbi:hypothetical protein ACOLXF_003097 [Vibrio fluvialis]